MVIVDDGDDDGGGGGGDPRHCQHHIPIVCGILVFASPASFISG